MKKTVKALALLIAVLICVMTFSGCIETFLLPLYLNQVSEITSSAEKSSRVSDAAALDSAVKNYYAAIISGVLNESNKPISMSAYTLPSLNASDEERKNYADHTATLKEAMLYKGFEENLSESIYQGEFGYSNGSIICVSDQATEITVITDENILISTILKK